MICYTMYLWHNNYHPPVKLNWPMLKIIFIYGAEIGSNNKLIYNNQITLNIAT